MKVSRTVALAGAAVLSGALVSLGVAPLAGAAPQAVAAADVTGPYVQLQPTSHIVVGSTVTNEDPLGYQYPYLQWGTDVELRWSGSDPSGICRYQLWWDDARGPIDFAHPDYQGTATRYRFHAGDTHEESGGYNFWGFDLRAKDCAGNWSKTGIQADSFLFPATDRYVPGPNGRNSLFTTDHTAGTFKGTWTMSTCTCFVGGTNRHSAVKNDSMTFTYTASVFAWIGETGPKRGSARVYQDGVLKATVNTYAAANTGPKVLWSNWFSTPTKHTIKIVVVGTSGHSRVDIDGFFTGTPDR